MAEKKSQIALNTDFNPLIIHENNSKASKLFAFYLYFYIFYSCFFLLEIDHQCLAFKIQTKSLKRTKFFLYLGKIFKIINDNQILQKEIELFR